MKGSKNSMGSRRLVVLEYLKKHKSGLTSVKAELDLGVRQLQRHVFDLRMKGYEIDSVPEHGKNKDGKDVRYVRYVLRGKK